jgi:hypothetical protein
MGAVAAIAGGGALLGGILAAGEAESRNRSIRKQADNTQDAARLQAQQLAERRSQQLDQNRREAAALRGRLLASAADRGASGVGTSTDALGFSIDGSFARANRSTETNYSNALQQVRLGTQSSIDQLFANYQSPVLAGLKGALGGASTGLQIGQGYNQLFPDKPKVDRFPYGS